MTFNIGKQEARNISNVAGDQYIVKTERIGDDSRATIKVLLLAADPVNTDRLRLGEEARAIDEALRQAGDKFELRQAWAARIDDLVREIVAHQPEILHFSGHGSPSGALLLEDAHGRAQQVETRALASLLAAAGDSVRCVVLNGCYTGTQASELAGAVPALIGTTDSIRDDQAVRFSSAFYQGIAHGRTVREAFHLGRANIELHGLAEAEVLALKERTGPSISF